MFYEPVKYAKNNQPVPVQGEKSMIKRTILFVKDSLALLKQLAQLEKGVIEFPALIAGVPYFITDADFAHEILVKQYKSFPKSVAPMKALNRVLGEGLVTITDIDNHKTQRKLIQPGFHFRKIQAFSETMVEYTNELVSEWQDGDVRDFSEDMHRLTMHIVLKTLFDTNASDMKQDASVIAKAILTMQEITIQRFRMPFQIPDSIPIKSNRECDKAMKTIGGVIDDLVASRQLPDGSYEDKGDLLSMMLLAEYEDGTHMDREQLKNELITMFAAGHETSSNAMTWALHLIALNPEVQERLYEEATSVFGGRSPMLEDLDKMPYNEMVMKEVLRMYPPAWGINLREAKEQIEIGEYILPAKRPLAISPYLFHYSPHYFPDPEKFDPERFSPEREKQIHKHAYIPFGGGPRVCIGQSFAMIETRLILAIATSRFQFFRVEGHEPQPKALVTLSSANGMKLKLKSRPCNSFEQNIPMPKVS